MCVHVLLKILGGVGWGAVGTIGRTHVLSLSVTTTAGSGGETGREASAAHLRIGSYVISAQNG